jgi:hypothetical protein
MKTHYQPRRTEYIGRHRDGSGLPARTANVQKTFSDVSAQANVSPKICSENRIEILDRYLVIRLLCRTAPRFKSTKRTAALMGRN